MAKNTDRPDTSTVYEGDGFTLTFTETQEDGGGCLDLIATSDEYKELLIDMYFRNEPKATKYAALGKPDPLAVHLPARDTKNYGREAWYCVPVALDNAFFEPYKKMLKYCTGYTGDIPDLVIRNTRPLCHTHHRTHFSIRDGHIYADVYVTSHDWNGQTAAQYAQHKAEEYLKEDVGFRDYPREYIPTANGLFRHNPDWGTGKRLPVEPKTTNAELWAALFTWWRNTHANAAQLDILAKADALDTDNGVRPCWSIVNRGYVDFTIYYFDDAGKIPWKKDRPASVISWEEFRALK